MRNAGFWATSEAGGKEGQAPREPVPLDASTPNEAEQRLLAERIADLWLVPYTQPQFARLARAEHRRLREEDAFDDNE